MDIIEKLRREESMSSWHETNSALAKVFNLPRLTQKAVIVLRGDRPPVVRVTRLMIEDDDVSQITERFELRKVGAGETAPDEEHRVA